MHYRSIQWSKFCPCGKYHDCNILSCLDDEPSSSGDVSHGEEPSHPVEEETGNQVVTETKLEPGALELYQPESQMSESAHDDLLKSIQKSGMVI